MLRAALWEVFLVALCLASAGEAHSEPVGPSVSENGPSIVNASLRCGQPKHGERAKLRLAVLPEYPPEDSEEYPPIKVCEADCSLALPAGTYRLEVSGAAAGDVRAGTVVFTIDRDSEVEVVPASESRHATGVSSAITGMVIAGLATFLTAVGLFINSAAECLENCENDTSERRAKNALVIGGIGGAFIVGGGAIAAIGWRSVAKNRAPWVKVVPVEQKPTAIDSVRFGPVRMHSGWGLAGTMRF